MNITATKSIIAVFAGFVFVSSLISLGYVNATDTFAPVSVAITVSPSTICAGQSTHLSLDSINATSVSINQGIGSVSTRGDRNVSPTQTTIYTVTGSNSSGDSSTTSATVYVNVCNTPTPTPIPTPTPPPTPTPTPTPTTTPTPTPTGTIRLAQEVINNNGGVME